MASVKSVLEKVNTYSEELGLNLNKPSDRFLWFLASMLFAKRISVEIAMNTFKVFLMKGLTNPYAILKADWSNVVDALDLGGYVRYDFSTATNILKTMKLLVDRYGGSIDEVYRRAEDQKDLERRLMEFNGVGPVAVNIFLREMRGIWMRIKPKPSKTAFEIATRLGLDEKYVETYEARLIRVYIEYCKKHKCEICPLKKYCRHLI